MTISSLIGGITIAEYPIKERGDLRLALCREETRVRLREARAKRGPRIAIITALVVLFGAAAFVGVARATDRSAFCSFCHEMTPYSAAWNTGTHAGEAECIDCHVDPGFVPRLAHKAVALKELYAHVTGDTSFPRPKPAEVPDSRCTKCHDKIESETPYLNHAEHAKNGTCASCHPESGHKVTADAIRAAGTYNADAAALRSAEATADKVAAYGFGVANITSHKKVVCTTCHDMAKTGCAACHKPDHEDKGADCASCHAPGDSFAFKHSSSLACESCHQIGHDPYKNAKCIDCHTQPGVSWASHHPASTACATCHAVGHKSVGTNCASCHTKPGVSWTAKHPTSGNTCTQCHTIGHKDYGQPCLSCHKKPGVNWSISHPSTGGEHTYKSFACAKCHPTTYTKASCTCHGGNPPKDD